MNCMIYQRSVTRKNSSPKEEVCSRKNDLRKDVMAPQRRVEKYVRTENRDYVKEWV